MTAASKSKEKNKAKEFYAADYGKLTSFVKPEEMD